MKGRGCVSQDVMFKGTICASRLRCAAADSFCTGTPIHSFGGTSSTGLIVAGVAALGLSAIPRLITREVRDMLESTIHKIVDTNPDPLPQRVLGTYNQDNHDQLFGYGMVNVLAENAAGL
jgi:hypothetical protein